MIPSVVIAAPFLLSFLLFAYQYYTLSPDRRIWNLQFIMMALAIALVIAAMMLHDDKSVVLSLFFLMLGIAWLGIAIWLLRSLRL